MPKVGLGAYTELPTMETTIEEAHIILGYCQPHHRLDELTGPGRTSQRLM